MLCTFCLRQGHVASSCPRRKAGQAMRLCAAIGILALGGCATQAPPAPHKLTPPEKSLMESCKPLPDVPANDGNVQARSSYYITTRKAYGECAQRVDGLQGWTRGVLGSK